jgi:hypothetical protein
MKVRAIIALLLAFPVTAANWLVFPFPMDPGGYPHPSWYVNLRGYLWSAAHLPGLYAWRLLGFRRNDGGL